MENKKTILTSEIKKEVIEKKKTEISRRSFLKRSAYSAPVLMAMGQLAKPTLGHADGSHGPAGNPGTAGGWNP